MHIVKSILFLLFIIVIGLFIFQNLEIVRISFLNWHLEVPLSLASGILYILGAVSGGILFSMLKRLSFESSDKKSK